MSKVFVAMSGGVDSSVAALLLKNQGYDVVGVFMRCYNVDGCQERDAEDARRVAAHLQIPFYAWDFEEEYKERVVNYMVEGYRKGITPNPDVMCNKEIKFGLFFKRALAMGADYVATGHHVRLERDLKIENYKLKIAKDLNKDQSYFLWTLTQKQLKHCLFPIGDYLKSEVREIARRAGLPTAEKKDSQGICFLGKVTLDEFLKTYIPPKKGSVLLATREAGETTFKKIGDHNGAHFYTIGQRHGLDLSDKREASHSKGFTKPHYVAEKNIAENTVMVAEGSDNTFLYKKEIELTDINFITPQHPYILEYVRMSGVRVLARVRYRQPLARATLMCADKTPINADWKSNQRKSSLQSTNIRVVFEKPQKFVAPGQSAVFYTDGGPASAETMAGREMLGGGVIV